MVDLMQEFTDRIRKENNIRYLFSMLIVFGSHLFLAVSQWDNEEVSKLHISIIALCGYTILIFMEISRRAINNQTDSFYDCHHVERYKRFHKKFHSQIYVPYKVLNIPFIILLMTTVYQETISSKVGVLVSVTSFALTLMTFDIIRLNEKEAKK